MRHSTSLALSALSVLSATLTLLPTAAAISAITRQGKYLYDASGNRFGIKGVAYQPEGAVAADTAANAENGGFPEPSSYIDPLSSAANCTRDLPYLRQLGVNAVRVYSVNSSLDHDACMSMFSAAGIYVLLDISLPLNGSINRASPSWTTSLLNEYTRTIDVFKGYDNLLAFNIGNEVINTVGNTDAAPFVKAAARDIKAYLQSVGSSALVGYSAVDGTADFRNELAEYLTCGAASVAVDIYGLNNYEWCGNETLQSSNWGTITQGFSDLPVVTYMSEYGCITSPPRLWNEVTALFAPPVSDVFSGGVAFSYFPTSDGYGMVTFSADGQSVITSGDFERLSAEYNSTALPTTPTKAAAPAATTLACPASDANLLASSTLPPTPDEAACNCVRDNAFACSLDSTAADSPEIVGALLDYACSQLGQAAQAGANCDAIAGNGTSGSYGALAMCSPAVQLAYAMSVYYDVTSGAAGSCSFGGNGTVNTNAASSAGSTSGSNAAAASCLAAVPSGGVFTPSAAGGASQTGSASQTGASGASGSASASASGKAGGAGRTKGVWWGGLGMGVGAVGVAMALGGLAVV